MLIFENNIPTERNKIKHKTPSTHCGPIFCSSNCFSISIAFARLWFRSRSRTSVSISLRHLDNFATFSSATERCDSISSDHNSTFSSDSLAANFASWIDPRKQSISLARATIEARCLSMASFSFFPITPSVLLSRRVSVFSLASSSLSCFLDITNHGVGRPVGGANNVGNN